MTRQHLEARLHMANLIYLYIVYQSIAGSWEQRAEFQRRVERCTTMLFQMCGLEGR